MIKVGVVGGTGYTGVELLRLLVTHPFVSLVEITSRSDAGTAVADMFPNLRGRMTLRFSEPDIDRLSACDVVFFATPNGVAMKTSPPLVKAGVRVIDLAADFRLKDASEWQRWYGEPHACPELLSDSVYGLPEINRDTIKSARIVANPGCYPTAVSLGFLPLLRNNAVDVSSLIADAKSGVSGAGRKASVAHLFCEAADSMHAYGVSGHRHLPEIKQTLGRIVGKPVGLTFVPHLTPMIRGIHATLYGITSADDAQLQAWFEQAYSNEPFVDVMPFASHPDTRSTRGSNLCRISLHRPQGGNTVVVLSVIDNLVKGAAGQAVQNMNIMFGLEETVGLDMVPILP